MKRKYTRLVAILMVLCVHGYSAAGETPSIPEGKRTALGLYVTAEDAYARWLCDRDDVSIIDCRTPEEYVFVGHAPMAVNIPGNFVVDFFDHSKKKPIMKENPDFVSHVKKRFKTTDTLLIMCRSGGRSAKCVNRLAEAGFTNVYTVTDGFEGDTVKDTDSCFHGKRYKNGWKNAGNPWTYALDPALVYSGEARTH